MYAALSQAYREIAKELNAPLIPVGDAFHRAIASGKFADKPDADFDFTNATRPALPRQSGSLYIGWQWKQREDGKWKLVLDDRHASIAGRYLGACVWFESLFGESCEGNRFVPAGLDSADALELQRIAHKAGAEVAARPLLLANYYCWHLDGRHPNRPFLHRTYPSSETNALAKKVAAAGPTSRPGPPARRP